MVCSPEILKLLIKINKITLNQIIGYASFLLMVAINCVLLIFMIPALLPMMVLLYSRGRTSKKPIAIFAGLEHVIDKSVVRAEFLQRNGFKCYYYSFEKTGNRSQRVKEENIIKIPTLYLLDIILFGSLLLRFNPIYVELYTEGLGVRQIFYTILSRANNTLCILTLRGLYKYDNLRFQIRGVLCHLCNYVYYRETYMTDILHNTFRINKAKLFFDSNKVPINELASYDKEQKIVLFLNGMKKWRNIDIVIRSVKYVVAQVPDAKFFLVGARNEEEKQLVQRIIADESVGDYVEVYYWTNSPKYFYEVSSLFVLPADLIFCNFSLLEAMERGLPAIVADVPDAEKIVEHGMSGYICEKNEESLATYIVKLLKDEKLRQGMGRAARARIVSEFNDNDRMVPILELIIDRYGDLSKSQHGKSNEL